MNGGDPLAAWARTKAEHPAPGRAGARRPRAARRARDVSRTPGDHHAAGGRADHRRADARLLSLVVREHVDAGPVREQADARVLLPDRRRSVVAARAAGGVPARLQLPDALVDLDSRGLSGPLPALPASAPGRIEGAQVDPVRAGVVRRRVGALLRADDDRGGLRPAGLRRQARPARRSADPPRPLHRRHQAAHRGHVGRAGRAVVPRRGVHGGERARGAKPSAARSIRPISSTASAS